MLNQSPLVSSTRQVKRNWQWPRLWIRYQLILNESEPNALSARNKPRYWSANDTKLSSVRSGPSSAKLFNTKLH
jgi:hypothetical protein